MNFSGLNIIFLCGCLQNNWLFEFFSLQAIVLKPLFENQAIDCEHKLQRLCLKKRSIFFVHAFLNIIRLLNQSDPIKHGLMNQNNLP